MKPQNEIIQDALDDMDWTGGRLAREAGVTRQYIYQVLKGERKATSSHTIHNIATLLNIDPDILYLSIDRTPPDVTERLRKDTGLLAAIRKEYNINPK